MNAVSHAHKHRRHPTPPGEGWGGGSHPTGNSGLWPPGAAFLLSHAPGPQQLPRDHPVPTQPLRRGNEPGGLEGLTHMCTWTHVRVLGQGSPSWQPSAWLGPCGQTPGQQTRTDDPGEGDTLGSRQLPSLPGAGLPPAPQCCGQPEGPRSSSAPCSKEGSPGHGPPPYRSRSRAQRNSHLSSSTAAPG